MSVNLLKTVGVVTLISLVTVGCQHSPVRNPFEGKKQPKLGDLPTLQEEQALTKVYWQNKALVNQEPYLKLQPFTKGQIVYVADSKGHITAIDRSSGATTWKKNLGLKLVAGPTVIGDTLYVATAKSVLFALDPNTGDKKWEKKVNNRLAAPPVGADGIVVVNTIEGGVLAYKATDGEKLWQVKEDAPSLTLHFGSTPVIKDDKVIVGLSTGKLMAIELESGMLIWERAIAEPRGRSEIQRMVDISADPIVVNNQVYVVNYQGKLAAVSLNNGNLIWERDLSSYHNMAIRENTLYLTDLDHALWAIDRQSGATLWKQTDLKNRYITGPTVIGDKLAVADRAGFVHIVSGQTGMVLAREKLKGKIWQSPAKSGDLLLVGTHKGHLTAYQFIS